MDVSKIVLTEAEQSAFDLFRQTDSAVLTVGQFQLLIKKGLLLDSMDGKSGWFGNLPDFGICKLSDLGKDLRAYQLQQKQIARQQSRRYWITTGIAVVALVKSFMPEISAGLALLWSLLAQQ